MGKDDVSGEGEDEPHGVFRHAHGAIPRRIGDRHALPGGGRDVDVVGVPDAEETHKFESGALLEDLRIHHGIVEEHDVRVAESPDELCLVSGSAS